MTIGSNEKVRLRGALQSDVATGPVRVSEPRKGKVRSTINGERPPASVLAPAATIETVAQALSALVIRRFVFGLLVAATVALLAAWLASILAADGFSALDALLLIAFVVESAWTVHNSWNSVLGFALARSVQDPTAAVFPLVTHAHSGYAIFARTAIFMTLRNEDCKRAFRRLKTVKASLDATGHGDNFDYFVLSDSSLPTAIASEEAAIEAWRAEMSGPSRLFYRHRQSNVGFKAGNVFDFCQRWGVNYDFMLPLDADSLMTGETIVRLVRIMQANPRIGILQSLISGTPSTSLFERLLHFGPRYNARLCILGGSWWQADSGPFWGHNALIRVAPFIKYCRLPILRGDPPLGGYVLSHDQVEAVLMRRGGYEVRVLPEELGSYEDNPPALPDFLRRHLRWCQGNLQYLKLRHVPGLLQLRASRFYLWLALELFFSMAGMVLFVVLAAIAAASWPRYVTFPTASALALLITWMILYFTPKIVGTIDAYLYSPDRYGGRMRLLASTAIETVFSFLLVPIANFAASVFMIGLLIGKKVGWDGQRRDGYGVSWRSAATGLWQQTLFGTALLAFLALQAPGAILWFMPFLAGLILAIPFAVVTSSPRLGVLAAKWKLIALPEEFETPPEVAAVIPTCTRSRPVTFQRRAPRRARAPSG